MALSELSPQNFQLIERFFSANGGLGRGIIDTYPETLSALLDAARAEQKEEGSSVAGVQAGPDGPTDGQHSAGWFTMDVDPVVGRKFIALYDDGSGAVMFWRHPEGVIDHHGDEAGWPLKGYDRWAYLPDDLEFWCETGDEPLTLRLLPAETAARSPSEASAGNPATDEQNLYAHPPRAEQPVMSREAVEQLVGKHLGPHLAISPTPRHEAVVRKFADAILALPPPSPGGEQEAVNERDAFEAWALADHRCVAPEGFEERTPDNGCYYADDSVNHAYIGWRSRAALASPVRGAGEEELASRLAKVIANHEGCHFICERCGHQHDDHIESLDIYDDLSGLALSAGGEG